MSRSFDRRVTYIAVAATLAATLSLAACGRKAGLDAPPSSAVPQSNLQSSQPSLGESGTLFAPVGTPASPQQSTAQDQASAANAAPKKSFLLDWLLN